LDITKPTEFLAHLRRLAKQVTEAADAQKAIDANACVDLARGFQELDQWLCEGGDAPAAWAE
jgi:hypothetical protein